LIEVIAAAGKRLTYLYDEGEPDVRTQMDQGTKLNVSGRVTSGLTFSSGVEMLKNRTEPSVFGVVRFDRGMLDYRLSSAYGVIPADAVPAATIARLRVMELGEAGYEQKKTFDAPSNVLFIPAEYWAVNCCPICPVICDWCIEVEGDPECPPCYPGGGAPPEPVPDRIKVVSDTGQDQKLTCSNGVQVINRFIKYQVIDKNGGNITEGLSVYEDVYFSSNTCSGTPISGGGTYASGGQFTDQLSTQCNSNCTSSSTCALHAAQYWVAAPSTNIASDIVLNVECFVSKVNGSEKLSAGTIMPK
jgi:hypothetical protein